MKIRTASKTVSALVLLAIYCTPGAANAQACHGLNVKLHVDVYELRLTPKSPRCVAVPGSFILKIVSPAGSSADPGLGEVEVHEKLSGPLQIRGKNDSNPDEIIVQITGSAPPNTDHAYWIKVDGVGELDPMVRVVNNVETRRWYELQNVLEGELGMEVEELESLIREFGKN